MKKKAANKAGPGRPRNGIDREKVTYYIPKKLKVLVDDAAYWKGTSASSFVSELLLSYFERHTIRPRPKHKCLGKRLARLK